MAVDFSKSKLFIIFVSCTEIDRMEKKTGIKTFLKKSGKVLIWTAVIWTVLLAAANYARVPIERLIFGATTRIVVTATITTIIAIILSIHKNLLK